MKAGTESEEVECWPFGGRVTVTGAAVTRAVVVGPKGTKVGEPQLVSIDNIVKEVGESSRPASIGSVKARDTGMAPKKSRNSNIAEENNRLNRLVTTSGVKARGTGVVLEKSKNNKIAEKNNNLNRAAVGKGFRFAVLADSVDEKSVPHVEHKSKDKSPMVTTEDDDAKGPSIFKNTSNMGPPPCKEVAGIKSESLKSLQKAPKTKKASYAKQGLKSISKDLGQDIQKALDKSPM
ncbi:hypothetical protein ACOSQ2_027403 [Xanthoceras sorbifolium]